MQKVVPRIRSLFASWKDADFKIASGVGYIRAETQRMISLTIKKPSKNKPGGANDNSESRIESFKSGKGGLSSFDTGNRGKETKQETLLDIMCDHILPGMDEINTIITETEYLLHGGLYDWGVYAAITSIILRDDATDSYPISLDVLLIAVRNIYGKLWLFKSEEGMKNLSPEIQKAIVKACQKMLNNRVPEGVKYLDEEKEIAYRLAEKVSKVLLPYLKKMHGLYPAHPTIM